MSNLTRQVRTHDNLLELLNRSESGGWVVSREKEREIANVQIVNWDGTQMIQAAFDQSSSYRLKDNEKRLVIKFSDGKIINCNVDFDSQNPVRYFLRDEI